MAGTKIRFLQSARIGKTTYTRGVHLVQEAHLKDKFFHSLLKAGLVTDAESEKQIVAESFQDRQKRLAEKIGQMRKPAAPSPSPALEPVPTSTSSPTEQSVEEASASPDTDTSEVEAPHGENESEPKKTKKLKHSKR